MSRLIRWYNKPGDITKEFWEKPIQFHGTFHGLKITNWKYKKALTAILKENLRFKQLLLNYINNQKKQTEKERVRLGISSIRVGVVAKTDDEVYVSSILYQRRSSCWKYRKWFTYFENCYRHAKMTEKKTMNFPVSPYCTLLFSRKEYIKFSEVVLVAVHCNFLFSYLMIAWISALKYYQYNRGYLLAPGKRQLKQWTYYQAY